MAPGRPDDDAEAPGLLSEERAPLARGAPVTRGRRAAAGGGVLLGCAALLGVAAWRTAAPAQVAKLPAGDVSGAISAFKVGGGFFRPGPRGPRVDAKLISARTQYSEPAAEAFAALAKTAYCGPLPGLFSSVALTCSALQLPGATSSCERASFEVVPGFVRAFQASDLYQPDAIFGYVARVQPVSGAGASPVEPGVVIAVRGSIENGANSKRDKDVALKSLENCDGCSVHEGFHEEYRKIEAQLDMYLTEFNCRAANCKLYVTGHGSGADVAALAAWELVQRNYSVGTSYLFSSSMVGNDVFARRMSQLFEGGAHGPIFRVTSGKDSSARWPFDAAFKQWGIQAHYASHADENVTEICYADDGACGVNALKQHELNSQDTCKSAKAPDGDFCVMKHFGGQCYGGLGFKVLDQMAVAEEAWLKKHGLAAAAVPELPQPEEHAATAWHPAEADGKQAEASAKEMRSNKPEHFYSLKTLQAVAALAKISYCGGTAGVASAVQGTCAGGHGVCAAAGFGVVPDSVVPVEVADQDRADAMFFYTALLRRTTQEFAGAPYFVPSETCALVIRGTANEENMKMNNGLAQQPLDDPECPGCTVSKGIYRVWTRRMHDQVVAALRTSGCEPNATSTVTNKVMLVGHSMGGTMSTLAMYFLRKEGFAVQLSWSIAGGRPGNKAFVDFLNYKAFAHARTVPMWHVTHWNDGIPRWPNLVDGQPAGHFGYHVHFNTTDPRKHVLCTTPEQATSEGKCGIFQFPREELMFKLPSSAHCELPFAPQGNICMFGVPPPMRYSAAVQCSVGGAFPA